MVLRIYTLRDLADVSHDLGIALEVVEKLGVRGAKQSLANRAEPRLGGWATLLGAFVPRQKRLEVDALKFLTSVHDKNLRQARMTANTFAQNHHARTIAGWIECEIKREDAPTERVGEQGQPGTSKRLCSSRAHSLNIQFRVVDMDDLEGAISVPWRLQFELPIERLQLAGDRKSTRLNSSH